MLTPDEKIILSKAISHLPSNPVVFDVGAYKGEYTDYVLSVLPGADCYLFEPNKSIFNQLVNYKAYNLLLSDTSGEKRFYQCTGKADEMSSLYPRPVFEQVSFHSETVKSTTIDKFCRRNRIAEIDFLKIDVEGAELDVLRGSVNMLKRKQILFAQVEYGGTYPDAGITFKQVIEYLESFGYKAYELKGEELSLLTAENFIEDYRFANFLITHLCIST